MSAPIPMNKSTTVQAIYRLHEAREAAAPPRGHMGASVIGHRCERALWYSFRWATPSSFSGRMLRLFERGQLEESRFVAELRGIGAEVFDADPETGDQFRYADVDGHFGGSMDGAATGLPEAPKTWHVLEFKTHNLRSFGELKNKGVRESKPEHWAQMQCYMGWSGMDRALYLAVCKDNDELYAERIEADPLAFIELVEKARRIIRAAEPPQRISNDPAWWVCKMCDHRAACHGESAPAATCRTCAHSTPIPGGEWNCGHWQDAIPLDAQREGCEAHRFIPSVLAFAEPIDATPEGAVIYACRMDGQKFVNGESGTEVKDEKGGFLPVYPSSELAGKPAALIADPFVSEIKATFHAKVATA